MFTDDELEKIKGLTNSLVSALDQYHLTEIELTRDDFNLRMVRSMNTVQTTIPSSFTQPVSTAPVQNNTHELHAEKNESKGFLVRSPMVGTVYLAPSPEASPFVSEGDRVKEGDPLLIIEAMKVMNRIPSPCSGIVEKIYVSNSFPAEYDEILLSIIKE